MFHDRSWGSSLQSHPKQNQALSSTVCPSTLKSLIEKGKPTVQLQKVLDVLDLLGLELTITQKTSREP